jgi:hypothetical protein
MRDVPYTLNGAHLVSRSEAISDGVSRFDSGAALAAAQAKREAGIAPSSRARRMRGRFWPGAEYFRGAGSR